jgi:TFIIF-interacting CTD phosphatase-like protein
LIEAAPAEMNPRRDESPSYGGHLISRALDGMRAPPEPLLPPMDPLDKGKYTLVLDMDGTLLTEFTEDKFYANKDYRFCGIDFVVEQQLTGTVTFIAMRPYLGQFLKSMAELFEIVIFTESPQKGPTLYWISCQTAASFGTGCTEILALK